MKTFFLLLAMLAVGCGYSDLLGAAPLQILVNHLGYDICMVQGRTQLAFFIDLPAPPGNYQLEAALIQPGDAPVRSLRDFQLK